MALAEQKVALPRWRRILDVIATLSVVAASLSVTWAVFAPRLTPRTVTPSGRPSTAPPTPTLPNVPVSVKGAQTIGSPAAKVALVVYTDFQCPFCARLANDTFPEIRREHVDTGRVLLIIRHFPLTQIHPLAAGAAAAAVCSGRQGRFWEVHDAMFRGQTSLEKSSLAEFAAKAGVDRATFNRCLDSDGPAQVAVDQKSGAQLSVSGTPALFVGSVGADGLVTLKKRLTGAVPVGQISDAIDEVAASVK